MWQRRLQGEERRWRGLGAALVVAANTQVSWAAVGAGSAPSRCIWTRSCSARHLVPATHFKRYVCHAQEMARGPPMAIRCTGGAQPVAVRADGTGEAGLACMAAHGQRRGPRAPPMRDGLSNPSARVPWRGRAPKGGLAASVCVRAARPVAGVSGGHAGQYDQSCTLACGPSHL